MKRLIMIMSVMAIAAMAIPFCSVDISAEPAEPTVLGVSKLTDGASLQFAITTESKIAYPEVTWYVYTPVAGRVIGTDSVGTIVDEELDAGLHKFTRSYAKGTSEVIEWNIEGTIFTYRFAIASSASDAVQKTQLDVITIDPDVLDKLEVEVAVGCTLLVLAPSLFLVPFWRRRKDRGWSDAFE